MNLLHQKLNQLNLTTMSQNLDQILADAAAQNLSLAAALSTSEVADGISRGALPVLAHGPTFMGNPLACAVANAAVRLARAPETALAVRRIEAGLRHGLDGLVDLSGVKDVRVCGAIGVVQLASDVDMVAATEAAVARGVWLRPFRDLIYAMPPFISTDEDVGSICAAIGAAVEASTERTSGFQEGN